VVDEVAAGETLHQQGGARPFWDAITDPEYNRRFGYLGRSEYDLRPGGAFRAVVPPQATGMPEVVANGEVLEANPPRKLVQTWRFLYEPLLSAETIPERTSARSLRERLR
jgi:uncharacterized protein YndB with AHSA1/START domain